MKVIILPYFYGSPSDLSELIKNDEMKATPEMGTDQEKCCATLDYSLKHKKFIIHPDSGITLNQIKKQNWSPMGNNVTKTTIDGIPCIIVVLKGGSDVSEKTIDRMAEIIKQENIKAEYK